MRLFLSSYRAGKYPGRMVELFGKGTKMAVVTNAKDYKNPEERKAKVKENLDYFTGIGLKPEEIDLRKYFKDQKGIERNLSKYTAFWLAGGNVFLLRRALRQSGLEPLLGDWVRKNEIVLGGESAGAIIVGPTLKHSEMDSDEDSPHYIVDGYDKEIIWSGLDFVTYIPVPHYKTPDYGSEIDKYIAQLDRHKIPYKTMTDEQAIIISGSREEILE